MSSTNPLHAIRHLDYTVIFCRDLPAMRRFYAEIMGFSLQRELGPTWLEFRIGASVLALTQRGGLFDDPPPPSGALSLQLAFRVAPREVDACAEALRAAGVHIEKEPQDQPWGHRTVFFRDPDGNVLEIYADI
jgi:lactoylglutathione lyase